jgi:hypothetical protein
VSDNLRDAVKCAEQDLESWIEDNREEFTSDMSDVGDEIAEIADSAVPIYNSTLLEWAAENNDLALVEPELGPAFDGAATPVNIIAANIYEYITEALWAYAYGRREEVKDELEAEQEALLEEEESVS